MGDIFFCGCSDKKPPDAGSFFGGSAPGQNGGADSSAQGQSTSGNNSSSSSANNGGGSGNKGANDAEAAKVEKSTAPTDEGDGQQASAVEGGAHECAVCKAQLENFSMSRPLSKSNCVQYGITEAALTADMRVCSSCRCRCVRRRYTNCPVPSCKTPKRKVKRLRHLPSKLQELAPEVREPIVKDLRK
jgi:nuclear receptor co-repressor 1